MDPIASVSFEGHFNMNFDFAGEVAGASKWKIYARRAPIGRRGRRYTEEDDSEIEDEPSSPNNEDLADIRTSDCLGSFSSEQRTCMIEYLNYETQGLINVFKLWYGKDFSSIAVAAALEELHDNQRQRAGYSKGRTEDTLELFSKAQRSSLQGSVNKSVKKVAVEFRKKRLPSRDADDIDEALLELRGLLVNPAGKFLMTSLSKP